MKRFFFKELLLIVLIATTGVVMQISAQQTTHRIILNQMNYLLYLPDEYGNDTTKKWPMMVFLHGVGECGDDVEKVKLHGPPHKIANGYKYPFIVVSPQSPERGWQPDIIQKLVIDLQKNYRVDEDRIYLTGLSMGGFGTWHTAQAYPELFAAIVPICGGGNPHTAWKLENMPVWCFHGAKDNVVEIARSQEMIDSLKAYNSSDVKFTIYPEAGHDSWTEAYNNEDVYRWMLSHKRFKYEELPIRVELLNEYAGTYTNENARIQVNVRDNGLTVVVPGDEAYAYKYAGNDNFFRDADNFKLIKFNRDKNNKITEFSLYQGQYEVVFFK